MAGRHMKQVEAEKLKGVMNNGFKRMAGTFLACVMAVSLVPAAMAAEAAPETDGQVVAMDVSPRLGGSTTTPVLPRNVTGADSIVVWKTSVAASDIGETFYAKVSNFTNGMSTVNVAIRINNQYVAGSFGMRSGDDVEFDVPAGTEGTLVEIYMSTDSSTPGTCRLTVSD